MKPDRLYHILPAADWPAAELSGVYRPASLQSEGFIHCSTGTQVLVTAARYYRGVHGLALLEIDPALVKPEIRYEAGPTGELFPHIYGPLNAGAVLALLPFEPGADGRFAWPQAGREG